jgi:signal transduction histidine kinase
MQFGNEEIILTIFLGTLLILFFAFCIVFLFILFKNKNNQNIREKEEAKRHFTQAILQSQLEIKEQTLRHIAFELHDNLGQIASLIKINLNTIQLEDAERSVQKIEATKELTRQLIADLKSLSISLNSDRVAQLGLMKGLEDEVERLNKTGQFKAVLEMGDSIPLLNENATIILYRMVQEILNNIVKHSAATHVFISPQVKENLFTLVIRDNGVGFHPEDKLKSGGSGLINLTSRAKLIQALFSIQSSPGEGTNICIELPVNKNAEPTSHYTSSGR